MVFPDTTPPVFQSAETSSDGTKIILTYNENLMNTVGGKPAASTFTVLVDGQERTVTNVVVTGMTVELTLVSPVTEGQSVTVAYTDPTAGNDASAIQDWAGNDAVSLPATPVTNNAPTPLTLDLNGPAAGVNRTVNFDPAPNAMTFTTGINDKNALGGQLVGEHQIETFGKVEIVFNKNHFTGTDSLTLFDSSNNTNPIAINNIGGLTWPASGQTNVAFTLGGESFGYSLFSTGSGNWTLVLNTANSTIPMTSARVELLLDALVYSNTASPAPTSGTRPFTVKLYEPGLSNVHSTANLTVDFAPADTTPPVLLNAETSTDGTRIFLTYDELLDATHTAASGDFSVMVGGGALSRR